MTLIEGFTGFTHWPLSRKVVLLGTFGFVGTVAAGLVNTLAHAGGHYSVMDLDQVNRYIAVWALAQLLVTAANLPAARAARAGRPGAYVFVTVQGAFMAGLLHLFGTMGTPLVAIFPALVMLWTLLLDERVGLFGLAAMVICILVIGVLEGRGLLPYAPVLLDRSVDAQNSAAWFGSVLFHILVLLGVCLSLLIAIILSRRAQDARLREAHVALARVTRLIRRYVPAQLADQIVAGDYQEDQPARRRRLTTVFTDVVGFTAASEALPGEVLDSVLNHYLSEMVAIADQYGGTINQLVGDGIMIFFGAPQMTNDHDHALRAVRMALHMQRRVQALQTLWSDQGWPQVFRIRVGINTGDNSVGDFGSAGRKLYSSIGLQTNLAQRIQTACEPGNVLIHQSTWSLVRRDIPCEPQGEITVKGYSRPLVVYKALDTGETLPC